jgi:hypothetical protein
MRRVIQLFRAVGKRLGDFWRAPSLKQQFLESIQEPDRGLFSRFNKDDSK